MGSRWFLHKKHLQKQTLCPPPESWEFERHFKAAPAQCGHLTFPTVLLDVHVFGLHGKTRRESEAICKQPAGGSRSASGLRADQRATTGAIVPPLHSTMSLSLIKGLLSGDGQVSSRSSLVRLSSSFFFFLKLTWKSSKLNLYLDHLFAKCFPVLRVKDGKFGVTEGKCKIFIYFQSHARQRRE